MLNKHLEKQGKLPSKLKYMVNVAQMVEHQIVALVAVGSIPTIHPIIFLKSIETIRKTSYIIFTYCLKLSY